MCEFMDNMYDEFMYKNFKITLNFSVPEEDTRGCRSMVRGWEGTPGMQRLKF